MSIRQEIQRLQCAREHDCAKQHKVRCAFCILDYKHIIQKPYQLNCGHFICAACKPEPSIANHCKRDGKYARVLSEATTAYLLLQSFKVKLYSQLLEKYKKAVVLIEGHYYT